MKVIVTTVRNEAPWLLEWIAYHQTLGFDYFIIYTNDNTDDSWTLFEKLIHSGGFEIYDNPLTLGDSPQKKAFSRAYKRLVELKPDWVVCLDPDEYINLKDCDTIDEFLNRHPMMDAIAVNWRFFGSSGLKNKGMGLTTERFLHSSRSDFIWNRVFKTIFRFSKYITGFGPHRPWFRADYLPNVQYCFPSGHPLKAEHIKPCSPLRDATAHIEFDVAQINHYAIRSSQEYAIKKQRGNGMKPNESGYIHFVDNYFSVRDRNEQLDDSILKFIPRQKSKYLDLIISLDMTEWAFKMERNLCE